MDGWRFLSVLLVLISHSKETQNFPDFLDKWIRWLPNGDFGVEFFFVISGFLITFLMLKEHEKTSNLNIGQFYLRRIFRILPAYFTYLLVLYVLVVFTSLKIPLKSWIALLTFTVNYIDVPWIGAHIWSLSVEEQFYMIWPILFWFLIVNRNSIKSCLLFLAIPIAIAPIFRTLGYIYHYPFPVGYHSFFCRSDSLAIGSFLAFILFFKSRETQIFIKKYIRLLLFLSIVLIGVPLVLTRLFIFGVITVPLANTSNAIAIALIIGISINHPNKKLFRWLEWKPFISLGVMSYSIYLWQMIFCTKPSDFGMKYSPWFLIFPYWFIPVFLVAFLSYNFIEKPFLNINKRLHRN